MTRTKKFITLISLYLAQAIPMSFFSTIVPVIMRQENYSLESIGYLQLVKLPWIIKFLWAPVVDKKGVDLHHYRRWIIWSELFYAVVILGIGFFQLEHDFSLIIVFMLVAFFASATQDIATDAFAIISLEPDERGMGNSMQSAGTFLGTLTGSGILLVIYHYYGWQALLLGLAGFVLFSLWPLFAFKLPARKRGDKKRKPVSMMDIVLFFKQKGIWRQVVLLFIYYSGLIGILTMIKPFLVDLGYPVKDIGFISGIFGTAVGASLAFLAGYLIKRWGRGRVIRLISLTGFLAAVFFTWVAFGNTSLLAIHVGVALVWGSYGMASVMIYTIAMDITREGREGTDFTIQIVLTHLSSLAIAVFSGRFADHVGYKGLFMAEAAMGLVVLLSLRFLYPGKNIEPLNH